MNRILRALLISAVATGTAAVVLKILRPEPPRPPAPARAGSGPYVDADRLTEEQRDLLMQEMEAGLGG